MDGTPTAGAWGEEEGEGPCKVFFKGLCLGHLRSGLYPLSHLWASGFHCISCLVKTQLESDSLLYCIITIDVIS